MRQRAGVGVAVGVWQTILPVLSRPLISVTGPVICTAGSSWHFLSQRQYARTHVQTLMYADTHGGTQPYTLIRVCPCVSKRHKGTLQRCPTMVSHHKGGEGEQTRTCILVHTQYLHNQGQTHTQGTRRGPAPEVTLAIGRYFAEQSMPELMNVDTPPSPPLTAWKGDRRRPSCRGYFLGSQKGDSWARSQVWSLL